MTFLISTNPIVTISGIAPIIVTEGTTPAISIQNSTLNQKGAVQLEDSISSTSTVKAATPNSVKEVHNYATTMSGGLQTDIDGKSDLDHIHDDRYYTESEVDYLLTTLSGVIDLAVAATRICNTTGATLTKGTAVTICGMSGALCCVCKSDNREFTKMPACGIIDTDIANGAEGNMIRIGKVDLDTSGMVGSEGDRVYTQGDGSIDTAIPTSGGVQRVGFLIVKAEAGTVCVYIRGRKSIYAAKDEHPILRMGNDAGHQKVVFKTYTNDEIMAVDSSGNLTLSGIVDGVDIATFKADYDSHDHDDCYYTESEVDNLITTVSGKLDDHNEMNNLDYASSGHIGFASSDILSMASAVELTLVSGTVTRTQTLHRIDTEGDVAIDDLDTVLGGVDGDIIIVRAENGTRTVTLKDGTGNLKLGGRDLELIDTNMAVMLFYSEVLGQWLLIGDGGGSATASVSDDAFSSAWDGGTAVAPSRNAVYDVVVTKSDLSHLHDDRYYTETEVDTISGTLQTDINTKLENIIEDVTPELGGDLSCGGYNLDNVGKFCSSSIATQIYNDTGATLVKGTAVTICGLNGAEVCTVCKTDNREVTKMPCCGIIYADIANGDEGCGIRLGRLNMDTSGMAGEVEDRLYVQSDGSLDTAIPTSGMVQRVGFLVKKAAGSAGRICICIRGPRSMYSAKDQHPIIRMGDDVGHQKIVFRDYNDNEVSAIDSNGNLTVSGTVDGVDIATFKSDYDSHDHDDRYYTESEVDTISGSLQTNIDNKATTLIDLTDTPSSYDTGKYLKSTVSGTEWATASGINGTIFIYDLTPDAGNISITFGENNQRVISALASVDVTQITCDVFAYSGHSNIRPGAKVNNQPITWSTSITKNPVAYLGTVTVPTAGSLIAVHEDGATHTVVVTTDAKPVISSVNFVNGYPGAQTELKSGDTFDINAVADINFVNIQVDSQQAFTSIQTEGVASGTDRTATFTIGDRGITTHTYPARVRVQKSTGTWSDWVWTNGTGNIDSGVDGSEVVALNNLYPSVESMVQGSVTYPASQEAIKNTESVTVHSTCSNFDTITYSSPAGELTIPNTGTYQEDKVSVTRNSGGYNVSSTNYRIVCVRTANNASITKNLVVYIAHDSCTISMTEPYAYLRSGGNDGTSAQNYTITLTSSQRLISTPTISNPAAGAGAWVGSFAGGSIIWTRTLQIHDTDTKGAYSYGTLSATNLANTETTTYTGDSSYTLRGFVSREIELAAFDNEVNMNVEAITYANVSMTWSAKVLPYKRSVGTTATPDAGAWCLHTLSTNPTIIRILDTTATDSQSQASTITIQEVI